MSGFLYRFKYIHNIVYICKTIQRSNIIIIELISLYILLSFGVSGNFKCVDLLLQIMSLLAVPPTHTDPSVFIRIFRGICGHTETTRHYIY